MPTINRAFAPMVRDGRFDVSEMAIATFLQARAYGKPLVLLPVTLAARFQQSALLCRAKSRIEGAEDLPGCRVGVRAYSQTTGMWLRGILARRIWSWSRPGPLGDLRGRACPGISGPSLGHPGAARFGPAFDAAGGRTRGDHRRQ